MLYINSRLSKIRSAPDGLFWLNLYILKGFIFLVLTVLYMIFQPWKTFRDEQPSNFVVQNILQYRFDQIFEPGGDDPDGLDLLKKKSSVPIEKLIKNCEEPKISRYSCPS